MPSSGKALTPEIAGGDSNLLSLWGGVFYHPAFVTSGADALGLHGESRYFESGGRVGVSNILLHERPGIKVATLPLMFQYFGPLAFDTDPDDSQHSRITFVPPDNVDFGYFSLPPSVDISGLPRGWRAVPQRTIVLDKKALGVWGNAFRDDVKNKIRKARREKIAISKTSGLPTQLWSMAYGRKSMRTPIAPTALGKWCDDMIAASLLTIYVASLDGAPVAFRGELAFGEYVYDWIAGSDPRYHATGANQLLMAEIGREIAKTSLTAWDLVGGEVERIADFKKSFGAAEAKHYHVWGAPTAKGRLFSAVRKLKYGTWRRS